MKCHKVDYKVLGDDLQSVEIELDPMETVIAEAGAMNYIDDGISFIAKMGDGSNPKAGFFKNVVGAGARKLTGESLFLTHFTNISEGKKIAAFSAPYPGKILALDMHQYGHEVTCQKNAFLAAALGTKISLAFHKKILSGIFGGEGFILQKIKGDGMIFLHGGGTIIQKQLQGQVIKVNTGSIMAFTKNIRFSIERVSNLKSMLFGGQGMFLATLKGRGVVWLQSLPFSRLTSKITKLMGKKTSLR